MKNKETINTTLIIILFLLVVVIFTIIVSTIFLEIPSNELSVATKKSVMNVIVDNLKRIDNRISAGGDFGIRQDASMTYGANNVGTRSVYDSLSRGVTQYRMCSNSDKASISFSLEDRVEAMGGNPIVPDLDTEVINKLKK